MAQLAITELTESVVALFFAFAPIVDINARRMIENNLVACSKTSKTCLKGDFRACNIYIRTDKKIKSCPKFSTQNIVK